MSKKFEGAKADLPVERSLTKVQSELFRENRLVSAVNPTKEGYLCVGYFCFSGMCK